MNRRGSFGGGGAAYKVDLECCRLSGTDFLGAMVGVVSYKVAKTQTRRRQETKRRLKTRWREKNEQPAGFIVLRNMRRFAAKKVALQRRRVSMRQRKYLHCCVPRK